MKHPIRTIVAGVADADGPDPVLHYTQELARRVGATLHLVHAYPPPDTAMSFGLAAVDMMAGMPPVPLWNIQEEEEEIEASLARRIRAQLGEGAADAQLHLEPGSAHEVVARVAAEVGADLVALGATHHHGLGEALLGSTTERTLRDVPAPTLVLRRPLPAGGSRVLLTTDLSPVSALACAAGVELAASLFAGERFVCRCLYTAVPVTGELALMDVDELEATARAELERFVGDLPTGGVAVEPVLRVGVPEEEIVAEAAAWPAELVVLGTHGRKGLSHLLLGSVAERVLRELTTDSLVVRAVKE